MTTPAAHAPQRPFDARPLVEPVDRGAVRQFDREMRRKYGLSVRAEVILWILFELGILAMFGWIYVDVTGDSPEAAPGTMIILALLMLVMIAIPLIVAATNKKPEQAYRISRFAAANGMTYLHQLDDPQLPGMIFQQGNSRKASMLVRGEQPRFVEFGNYQYDTGSGKSRTTHTWGYVAVKLDVPLPNIVLDALGNNTLGSNLPIAFTRDQRLSLEGDFDRYFSLYCPNGYEADALYLFTPDIMARFIDHAAQLDVEIVDDWMFLYMQRDASTVDVATWAWLFATVGALLTKFAQWARWRDDRLRIAMQAHRAAWEARQRAIPDAAVPASVPSQAPATQHPVASSPIPGPPIPTPPPLPWAAPVGMVTPPGVAYQGRRLKKRFNWVLLAVLGGGVGVVALGVLLLGLIGLFSGS